MPLSFRILTLVTLLSLSSSVLAQATAPEALTAFKQVRTIEAPLGIVVPTVIEFPLELGVFERNTYALYDIKRQKFLPYAEMLTYTGNPASVNVFSGNGSDMYLTDGNQMTSADFYMSETGENVTRLTITTSQPVTSSGITLDLAPNVALPTTVGLSARLSDGSEYTIVTTKSMTSQTLLFPETVSDEWHLILTYIQPLRINEVRIAQDGVENMTKRSIRFLGEPGGSYRFYHDADRSVSVPAGESGNLRDSRDVRMIDSPISAPNTLYKEADTDRDGVPDRSDNCVASQNTDQVDIDKNGRGDTCDDFDRDGITETVDNCPTIPNWNQEDEDGDGIGDVCDDEESRVTEKHAWIPWVGMGVALGTLIILFVLVATVRKPELPQPPREV